MKIKKFIRLLLIILIIGLFLTVIRSTYSKYVTSYDKQTGVGLLGWNIKVNNQRIVDNATFTNTLQVKFEENPNIADNVIAPTKQGTVELTLDSTGTQVPYQYEIEVVDGDVDYESSYTTTLQGSWNSGGNSPTTYKILLDIDYSHLDEPIWYYWNRNKSPWDSGFVYNKQELEFVLPQGFSLDASHLINVESYSYENGVLKLIPQSYEWKSPTTGCPQIWIDEDEGIYTTNYSGNKLQLQLHLTYNGQIDIDTEDFWQSVAIGGKKILKSNLPDYRIYAYELNGGGKQELQEGVEVIIGQVQPATDITTQVINKIKLYVEWYDGEDNIMDNAADVALTKIDNPYGTVPIRCNSNANRDLINL